MIGAEWGKHEVELLDCPRCDETVERSCTVTTNVSASILICRPCERRERDEPYDRDAFGSTWCRRCGLGCADTGRYCDRCAEVVGLLPMPSASASLPDPNLVPTEA